MNILTRRNFFRFSARTVAAANLGRLGLMNAFAAPVAGYKALVCIFQSGGSDGHNTIIPISAGVNNLAKYALRRPDLASGLTASALAPTTFSHTTTPSNQYALHPVLKDLLPIFNAGKLAILANVGNIVQPTTQAIYAANYKVNGPAIPKNLYSHSNQTLQWQAAKTDDTYNSGWAGRVVDAAYASQSAVFPVNIASSDGVLFGLGTSTQPTTVTPGFNPNASLYQIGGVNVPPRTNAGAGNILHQLLEFDNGLKLVQAANGIGLKGLQQHDLLASALNSNPFTTPWTATGNLAEQLKMVARIINASAGLGAGTTRQIFFVSHGTYDSHSNQRDPLYGGQDTRFKELNDGMRAFYDAMVSMGLSNKVTTFTNSEFGRTLEQSGSGPAAGSDHAWGGNHFIMGGAVKGNVKMYGTYPDLTVGGPNDALPTSSNPNDPQPRGVMVPTTSVVQYGATLARWFGVPETSLGSIFENLSNFPTSDLDFMDLTVV